MLITYIKIYIEIVQYWPAVTWRHQENVSDTTRKGVKWWPVFLLLGTFDCISDFRLFQSPGPHWGGAASDEAWRQHVIIERWWNVSEHLWFVVARHSDLQHVTFNVIICVRKRCDVDASLRCLSHCKLDQIRCDYWRLLLREPCNSLRNDVFFLFFG